MAMFMCACLLVQPGLDASFASGASAESAATLLWTQRSTSSCAWKRAAGRGVAAVDASGGVNVASSRHARACPATMAQTSHQTMFSARGPRVYASLTPLISCIGSDGVSCIRLERAVAARGAWGPRTIALARHSQQRARAI
eukprot:CAMPEP_0206178014 /NCGR_PEP_ID=MMETSP1474-20131121/62956_1 /ASSEMBLY_ACC=CAM_ASM_001110 /TAXON_ID=97495 /ORGANISM="Imantonia sp., Strain RCC918" /LENGTH=140 /DNA_ID=CAMNT_0053590207 /DNA_START=406 /DNA_END=829 /DNA_ORIENTATION=+